MGVRKLDRGSGAHFPFVRLYAAIHEEKYKWESSSESLYRPLTWKRPPLKGETKGRLLREPAWETTPPDPGAPAD